MPSASLSPLFIKIRIRQGDVFAFGPGKAALLDAIEGCRSIAAAGRSLGLSYSKTRRLVDEMNRSFRLPLVETAKGGSLGGGARVTETGLRIRAVFRDMEARAEASVQEGLSAIRADLIPPPES